MWYHPIFILFFNNTITFMGELFFFLFSLLWLFLLSSFIGWSFLFSFSPRFGFWNLNNGTDNIGKLVGRFFQCCVSSKISHLDIFLPIIPGQEYFDSLIRIFLRALIQKAYELVLFRFDNNRIWFNWFLTPFLFWLKFFLLIIFIVFYFYISLNYASVLN